MIRVFPLRLSNRGLSSRFGAFLLLGGLAGSSSACGPKRETELPGVSTATSEAEEGDREDPAAAPSAPAGAATTEPEPPADPDRLRADHEQEIGRAALAKVGADSNGLAVALVDRASDLPWILAIENRGQEPVEIAANPELARFEVLPPEAEKAPVEEATPSKTAKKTAPPAPPAPVLCGEKELPKTVAEAERLRVEPGQILTHSFDPRALCDDASILTRGARVTFAYGFPLAKKKVWSRGKMSEVEETPAAPFVATALAGTSSGSVKILRPEPFVLGETYPLASVTALPGGADGSAGKTPEAGGLPSESPSPAGSPNPDDPARASSPPPPPPPPLALEVKPLGTTREIDETTVTVTIRNRSSAGLRLFLRRELIAYEVIGPTGAHTCRMHPQVRAPDASAFDQLGAGSSRSLVTRVAEACPPDTFAAPGTYSVNARLEARDRGAEHGYDAFVGDIRGTEAARFTIRGGGPPRPRFFLSPRPTRPAPTSESESAPASAPGTAAPPTVTAPEAAPDATSPAPQATPDATSPTPPAAP